MISRLKSFVVKALPGAIVLTGQENARHAADIVNNLRPQGVTIANPEAINITRKVVANLPTLKTHFVKQERAFTAVQ